MNKMTINEFTGLKVVEMREHLGNLGVKIGSRATKDACVAAYVNWLEVSTTSAGQVPAPEVNAEGAKTGRFRSDQPNLANTPLRTEEGRELQAEMAKKTQEVMVGVDYAEMESRTAVLMNTGGETVSVLAPERPKPRPRGDEVREALRTAHPSFLSALRALKELRGTGGNRHQRRRTAAIATKVARPLRKAGITLEEALAVV